MQMQGRTFQRAVFCHNGIFVTKLENIWPVLTLSWGWNFVTFNDLEAMTHHIWPENDTFLTHLHHVLHNHVTRLNSRNFLILDNLRQFSQLYFMSKSIQTAITYPNAYAKVKNWNFESQLPGNWLEFDIIWNNFWSSTIVAIQIWVSFGQFKNLEIPRISTNNNHKKAYFQIFTRKFTLNMILWFSVGEFRVRESQKAYFGEIWGYFKNTGIQRYSPYIWFEQAKMTDLGIEIIPCYTIFPKLALFSKYWGVLWIRIISNSIMIVMFSLWPK